MLLTRSRPILRPLLIAGLLISLLNGVGLAAETDEPVGLDDDLIEEVLEVIGERYVDEAVLTDDNLTEGAIRGIIDALGDDGHTIYLTPEELEVERDALEGRVVGIGVVVDQRAGSTHIISVVDGSPADRAGLQAGDVITDAGGREIQGPGHLIEVLQGYAPGEPVHLGWMRQGERRDGVAELRCRRPHLLW